MPLHKSWILFLCFIFSSSAYYNVHTFWHLIATGLCAPFAYYAIPCTFILGLLASNKLCPVLICSPPFLFTFSRLSIFRNFTCNHSSIVEGIWFLVLKMLILFLIIWQVQEILRIPRKEDPKMLWLLVLQCHRLLRKYIFIYFSLTLCIYMWGIVSSHESSVCLMLIWNYLLFIVLQYL